MPFPPHRPALLLPLPLPLFIHSDRPPLRYNSKSTEPFLFMVSRFLSILSSIYMLCCHKSSHCLILPCRHICGICHFTFQFLCESSHFTIFIDFLSLLIFHPTGMVVEEEDFTKSHQPPFPQNLGFAIYGPAKSLIVSASTLEEKQKWIRVKND